MIESEYTRNDLNVVRYVWFYNIHGVFMIYPCIGNTESQSLNFQESPNNVEPFNIYNQCNEMIKFLSLEWSLHWQ